MNPWVAFPSIVSPFYFSSDVFGFVLWHDFISPFLNRFTTSALAVVVRV